MLVRQSTLNATTSWQSLSVNVLLFLTHRIRQTMERTKFAILLACFLLAPSSFAGGSGYHQVLEEISNELVDG